MEMLKKIAFWSVAAMAGGGLGYVSAVMGFPFSTWQYWAVTVPMIWGLSRYLYWLSLYLDI